MVEVPAAATMENPPMVEVPAAAAASVVEDDGYDEEEEEIGDEELQRFFGRACSDEPCCERWQQEPEPEFQVHQLHIAITIPAAAEEEQREKEEKEQKEQRKKEEEGSFVTPPIVRNKGLCDFALTQTHTCISPYKETSYVP